jgi:hypothetical protein
MVACKRLKMILPEMILNILWIKERKIKEFAR